MESKKYLLIAIASGLFAALLAGTYLVSAKKKIEDQYRPIPTVVAAKDIPAGTVATADMVRVEEVARKFRDTAALSDISTVVGHVLLFPAGEGAQLTPAHVTPWRFPNLGSKVERAKRAIAMAVDNVSAVGGFLQPGDRVDVIVVYGYEVQKLSGVQAPQGMVREKKKVRTFLQNVEVLAVGPRLSALEEAPEREEDADIVDRPKFKRKSRSKTVVLSLEPKDCQSIMIARSVGELFLSLRARGDSVVEPLEPVTAEKLFGEEVIAPPSVIWRVTGGAQ